MTSKVEIINLDILESMHTGTLMSRRLALLKCEESFELSDRFGHESKPNIEDTKTIEFKDSTEWQNAFNELKVVLAARENIMSKQELKVIRQQKASS